MKFLALLALLPLLASAQQTVTIPAQTITVVIPSQTVPVTGALVTCISPQVVLNGVCITPVPPPTTGILWVYYNGQFNWAGDYNFGSGVVTYNNIDASALSGTKDVLAAGDVGWQPYAPGNDFNTAGYNFITVSIKPTQAGNTWITGAEMVGDVVIPGSNGAISIMPYGPNPAVVGKWNTYKIPLAAYSITPGLHIYKVMFLEQSSPNKSANKVYFDNLGFVP